MKTSARGGGPAHPILDASGTSARIVDSSDGVYTVYAPDGPLAPVVFDSPHSGTVYPADFDHIVPPDALRRAEDMYVDALFGDAPAEGALLLAAEFPRSYIDPNRSLDDLDPELISEPIPGLVRAGEKARLGHGLVWRLCPPEYRMYGRKLSLVELHHRIERYWRPYHARLQSALDDLHGRFGAVWHVDCHSMPASAGGSGRHGPRVDMVLGDRDGTTCAPEFTRFVGEFLIARGYSVRLNDPYKGVELVRAYGAPGEGRHSLQIEINRALYMDERSFKKLPGFSALRCDLADLAAEICAYARAETALAAAAE